MSRHLKIAFIVAPFLAIGGYALVDQYQYYQQAKQAKVLYPLEVEGRCELHQDCQLQHELLRVSLKTADVQPNGSLMLTLTANHPLEGGKLGYGRRGEAVPQRSLRKGKDDRHWLVSVPAFGLAAGDRLDLRMALVSDGRVYIAEVAAVL